MSTLNICKSAFFSCGQNTWNGIDLLTKTSRVQYGNVARRHDVVVQISRTSLSCVVEPSHPLNSSASPFTLPALGNHHLPSGSQNWTILGTPKIAFKMSLLLK